MLMTNSSSLALSSPYLLLLLNRHASAPAPADMHALPHAHLSLLCVYARVCVCAHLSVCVLCCCLTPIVLCSFLSPCSPRGAMRVRACHGCVCGGGGGSGAGVLAAESVSLAVGWLLFFPCRFARCGDVVRLPSSTRFDHCLPRVVLSFRVSERVAVCMVHTRTQAGTGSKNECGLC